MFEDVCLVCSRPVQDTSSTYCSDDCAAHDALDVQSTSDDRSSASSVSSAPSPYLHPTTTKFHFGAFGLSSPDADLTLHNPHPTFNDYPLPTQIASPTLSPYSKPAGGRSPSAHYDQRQHLQRHMRKRSSLSSSSASSAFSTPSQPPLTDDDDSMSDPEFLLDVSVNVEPVAHAVPRPVLDYARRPSTTNTRSIMPNHHAPSHSSASSSMGRSERSRPRPHHRSKHAHHASAPFVDPSQALQGEDYDSLFTSKSAQSDLAYNRTDDLEASYATLTKLSLAPHDDSVDHHHPSSYGIDTLRQKKNRRPTASLKQRASLPAYFSLLKMNSPPARRDPTPSPPHAERAPQEAGEGSFSSPGSTRTARISRSATRPAPHWHTSYTRPQKYRTQSAMGTSSPDMHPNLHVRAEPVSSISTLHSFGAVYGVQKGLKSSAALEAAKVAVRGHNALAAVAAMVPLPAATPTSPNDIGPVPAHSEAAVEGSDDADARSHPLKMQSKSSAAVSARAAGMEGTPRGRTGSRSACPRSRSRSHSRSRSRRRAPVGPTASTRHDPLIASVAAVLGFATRGRPHARGIGGRNGRLKRGRRGTGTVMPALGSNGDEVLAVADAWYAGGYMGPHPRSVSGEREDGGSEIDVENTKPQLRGRKRGGGVPVKA